MNLQPEAPMNPPEQKQLMHLLGGPLVFAMILLTPLAGLPFDTRGALGLLVWMAWWWITRPVHLAVTGFAVTGLLPLAVASAFTLAPIEDVTTSYSQDTILLLLGANILTSVWVRWGLDRRIGLASLLKVGADTKRQIVIWFLTSAALSAILPNTIVAATMIPIVVAMLRSVGIEDLWNSRVGTALVIAVAWGTSAGGAATPLGGAPNLLTVGFIEESITGQEFLFLTWVTRLAPITLVIVLVMFLFMSRAMQPEASGLPGSKDYLESELRELGPMSQEERWGLGLFLIAVGLAFGRPLYADALPGLTPAFAFVTMAVVSFMIRTKEGPLITWQFAQAVGGVSGDFARFARSSSRSMSFSRPPRSRPCIGSSKIKSAGSFMRVRAKRTRCFSPDESVLKERCARSSHPNRLSSPSAFFRSCDV